MWEGELACRTSLTCVDGKKSQREEREWKFYGLHIIILTWELRSSCSATFGQGLLPGWQASGTNWQCCPVGRSCKGNGPNASAGDTRGGEDAARANFGRGQCCGVSAVPSGDALPHTRQLNFANLGKCTRGVPSFSRFSLPLVDVLLRDA
jgi:hypothetical protein